MSFPMDAGLSTLVTGGGPGNTPLAHSGNLDWQNIASAGITPVPTFAKPAVDLNLHIKLGRPNPLWKLMLSDPLITKRQTLGRPDFQWAEIRPMPERSTVAGSVSAQATQIAVNLADAAMITPKQTLRFFATGGGQDAEFWVTAMNYTTGIATGVFIGTPPAGAIAPGTPFIVCGSSYEQASFANPSARPQEVWLRNYHQYFRNMLTISDLAKNDDYQMPEGGYWNTLRTKFLEPAHSTEVEKALNFGIAGYLNGGALTPMGSPAGFLEGLYTRCVTHRHSMAGAPLNRAAVDAWLTPLFRDVTENGSGWVGLSAARGLAQMTNLFTLYEIGTVSTEADQAGIAITRYKHNLGPIVRLIQHYLYDFVGRRDLMMFVKLTPDDTSIVLNRAQPTAIRYREYRPPYNGSFTLGEYETFLTMQVAKEDETIVVIEDIGGNP